MGPIIESGEIAPASPYAGSKFLFESALRTEFSTQIPSIVVLRLFNLVGPVVANLSNRPLLATRLFPKLCSLIKTAHGLLPVFGQSYSTYDGTAIRDYIDVRDVVTLMIKILKDKQLTGYEVFNVGTGVGHSVLQVVQRFSELSGRGVEIAVETQQLSDVPIKISNSQKVREQFDWRPIYDLDNSIVAAIETQSK